MKTTRNTEMIAAAMGWIGTLGTICAYLMLSRGYLHVASLCYAAINFLGGVLGATASMTYGAWPSVASNLIWSGVAVYSAAQELLERRTRRVPVLEPVPSVDADPEPPTGPQPTLLAA